MLESDKYLEIESIEEGFYKEKGSKFFAYAFPVYSEEQIKEKLKEVKKIEYSAIHYCFAYIIYPDKSVKKESDDGEPFATAGKPILREILSHGLTNILIVVARYFGGVKLGIPGLIRSYKTAASDVISRAKIISKIRKKYYQIDFEYTQMKNVMRIIKEFNVEITNRDFQIKCKIIFAVPESRSKIITDTFQKNHKIEIKQTNI